jgi:hypothetical protein
MQSLSRQLRRGRAYIYFDHVANTVQVMRKKGADRKLYHSFLRNRLKDYEWRYCDTVTKPIRRWL